MEYQNKTKTIELVYAGNTEQFSVPWFKIKTKELCWWRSVNDFPKGQANERSWVRILPLRVKRRKTDEKEAGTGRNKNERSKEKNLCAKPYNLRTDGPDPFTNIFSFH